MANNNSRRGAGSKAKGSNGSKPAAETPAARPDTRNETNKVLARGLKNLDDFRDYIEAAARDVNSDQMSLELGALNARYVSEGLKRMNIRIKAQRANLPL